MLARIVTILFTFYILHFTFLITPVFAQSPTGQSPNTTATNSSTLNTTYSIPNTISPTSPLYTDMLLNNLFHTFSCLAAGQSIIGQPCLSYQVTKNAQGITQSIPVLSQVDTSGGVLGTATSLVGMLLETRPIKTSDYIASVGEDLGIVKTANAQVSGSGDDVLHPILALWQVSRNISYLIMIVIFVVIGVMIMFRNRINPQTVITAQAALPGLVIGLILITFSYFLAALLTDTAFIGTNLVGTFFETAQGLTGTSSTSSKGLSQKLNDENVLSIVSQYVGSAKQSDLNIAINSILENIGSGPKTLLSAAAGFVTFQYYMNYAGDVGGVIGGSLYCTVGGILGFAGGGTAEIPTCIKDTRQVAKVVLGLAAAAAAAASPGYTLSLALYFIMIAIIIYMMFKLLFRLATCFLSIIFYTIFAPFQFMFAALPGRQGIATGWVLSMLSNILAFPAVVAVLYFVNYILGPDVKAFNVVGSSQNITASSALPLLAHMNPEFYRLILAFGALIATPTIPDIIAKAVGKASQAGQMIGGEVMGGYRAGRGYTSQASGAFGQASKASGDPLFGRDPWVRDAQGNVIRAGKSKEPYLYSKKELSLFDKYRGWRGQKTIKEGK